MPTSASTGTEQLSTAGGGGDNYDEMTKEQLQEELRAQNKPVSGNVDELRTRLREPADDATPESTDSEDQPAGNVPPQPEGQGGVTSAVTSEAEIEDAKERAVEQGLRDEPVVTEANAELIDNAGTARNTPDGAVVVTREEDVVGGVRVDLPPSAPASPSAVDLKNRQGGTMQVARPDGTFVNLDTDDPNFEERAKAIREGRANH